MRNPLLLLLLSTFTFLTAAAQTEQTINLDHWNGKNNDIPFKITAVKDLRANTEIIGTAHNKSKKKDISFSFASSSEAMVLELLKNHFTHGTEADITLEINKLRIERIKAIKGVKDKFFFECSFNHTQSGAAIYKFNASNTVSPSKNPKLNVTNYVARAITAAVNNFKKDFIRNPNWKVDNGNASVAVATAVQFNKKIMFNSFEPSGDTIPLQKGYKLQAADFAGNVMDGEKDIAYSYLHITYKLKSIDEGEKINLTILPQGYFLRSKSWSQGTDSNKNWLIYQQLLYDNACIYALKLKEQLESKDLSVGYYKAEINKIYNINAKEYFNSMDDIQGECQFGEKESAITKWTAIVAASLATMD